MCTTGRGRAVGAPEAGVLVHQRYSYRWCTNGSEDTTALRVHASPDARGVGMQDNITAGMRTCPFSLRVAISTRRIDEQVGWLVHRRYVHRWCTNGSMAVRVHVLMLFAC
jgi:hypothetical protein